MAQALPDVPAAGGAGELEGVLGFVLAELDVDDGGARVAFAGEMEGEGRAVGGEGWGQRDGVGGCGMIGALNGDRGLAEALDLMAQALRAGQPIHRAAEEASDLRINVVLSSRFAEWGVNLREGSPIPIAARRAGLPSLVCEMLVPTHTGEQTAEVLEFLSRYYDVRFSRTWLLLRGAMIPAIVLLFGTVVLFVALALMMPLSSLITNISSHAARWRL